jgi:hypothetical protein
MLLVAKPTYLKIKEVVTHSRSPRYPCIMVYLVLVEPTPTREDVSTSKIRVKVYFPGGTESQGCEYPRRSSGRSFIHEIISDLSAVRAITSLPITITEDAVKYLGLSVRDRPISDDE